MGINKLKYIQNNFKQNGHDTIVVPLTMTEREDIFSAKALNRWSPSSFICWLYRHFVSYISNELYTTQKIELAPQPSDIWSSINCSCCLFSQNWILRFYNLRIIQENGVYTQKTSSYLVNTFIITYFIICEIIQLYLGYGYSCQFLSVNMLEKKTPKN